MSLNALMLGMLLMPSIAMADGVQQFVLDFNQRLTSELGPDDLTDDERQQRFADLIDGSVDLGAASARMLGGRWQLASAEDRTAFAAAFRTYLIRNFATRVRGIGDHRLKITGLAWDGASVAVSSEIEGHRDGPLAVDWEVTMRDEIGWRLADVTISKVSMTAVMRAQFDAVVRRDDPSLAAFIALLRQNRRDQ